MLCSGLCFSQKSDELEITEKIKKDASLFLLKEKAIEKITNIEQQVHIIEVLETKVLGYNKKGVYRLNSNVNPSFTYIILKNDKKFSIVDLRDFSAALKEITKFFDSSKFDNKLIVSYMEKILETYRNNDYDAKIRW